MQGQFQKILLCQSHHQWFIQAEDHDAWHLIIKYAVSALKTPLGPPSKTKKARERTTTQHNQILNRLLAAAMPATSTFALSAQSMLEINMDYLFLIFVHKAKP